MLKSGQHVTFLERHTVMSIHIEQRQRAVMLPSLAQGASEFIWVPMETWVRGYF